MTRTLSWLWSIPVEQFCWAFARNTFIVGAVVDLIVGPTLAHRLSAVGLICVLCAARSPYKERK